MAGTLACGAQAWLSFAAAGGLWDLRPTAAEIIDVSVTSAGGRERPGLRIHRVPTLRPDETTIHEGIPVTTVHRTLLDLAATLPPRDFERALDRAHVLELLDVRILDALAAAHPRHRGSRRVIEARGRHTAGATLTKSTLEERMLGLCRRHGYPSPRVNAWVAGLEVDFLFADERLAVETDGWQYHRTRSAFERDRQRDAILARAGYRVLRFTHRQVTRESETVAATIAATIAATRAGVP
jgi:very-short-patch-repair endonuclease